MRNSENTSWRRHVPSSTYGGSRVDFKVLSSPGLQKCLSSAVQLAKTKDLWTSSWRLWTSFATKEEQLTRCLRPSADGSNSVKAVSNGRARHNSVRDSPVQEEL